MCVNGIPADAKMKKTSAALVLLITSILPMLLQTTLAGEVCATHQFECSNGRCIPFSWACDGDDDCGDSSDEHPDNCRDFNHCAATEFQCENGRCIPHRWQCDGEMDCDDRSDEDPRKCKVKKCTDEEFSCKSRAGECIPLGWVCDFHADCSDGSDEDGCSASCSDEEFTCANGQCIQKRWYCDQAIDCGDGSDEGSHCPLTSCPPENSFSCGDRHCLPDHWRCDGDVDCSDGSDEMGCPSSTPNVTSLCNDLEFQCTDGVNCVHSSWLCDGDKDCPDGSDEHNCTQATCRSDQFRCTNGECIPAHLVCSGQAECSDSSDESSCNNEPKAECHPETEFDCANGLCIHADLVCNGVNDCGQWEDEPKGKCNLNECALNNGGCSHTCIDTALGFKCGCHPGYSLTGNSSCTDVDECLEPGTCSQLCTNEEGTFKCECRDGYTRDPHERTRCKANEGHAALLFTHRTDVRRFSLDRRDETDIVKETRSSMALDFHFESGMLFWSDVLDERIYKAPIDEGEVRAVVRDGSVVKADGLAVDWIYHHLYWTDASKNTIEVSDFDGLLRKTVLNDRLQEPRAIAVDPLDGWLYWSDWGGSPRIERCGMDGSNRQILVDSQLKWPNGIALDYAEKRLYWVDAKMHLIGSVNFDGSDRRSVLTDRQSIGHPFSVTVFEDWLYWSDWEHHRIMRTNKFNGKEAKSVTMNQTLQNPMVVHVYHPYRQPSGPNHCLPLNGRCSHLCLPAPRIDSRSPKYSCACPDGFFLIGDGLTCVEARSIVPTPSQNGTGAKLLPPPEVKPVAVVNNSTSSSSPITTEKNADKEQGQLQAETDVTDVTGVVIGVVSAAIVLTTLVGYLIYRQIVHRNATSMNFDNPVYRKTTEDKFALQKNQMATARKYPAAVGEDTMEPLTHPGTNEYV